MEDVIIVIGYMTAGSLAIFILMITIYIIYKIKTDK